MRARIRREKDILSVPEKFASLTEITSDGFFVYKIRYLADASKAFKSRSLIVNIKIMENRPRPGRFSIFSTGFNPKIITKRLQQQNSAQKDLRRLRKNIVIRDFRSDISKNVPNNLTLSLNRLRLNEQVTLRTRLVSEPVSVRDLEEKRYNMPILEANLNQIPEEDENLTVSTKRLRSEATSMILRNFTDPAVYFGARTNTVTPARKSFGGISPKRQFIPRNLRKRTKTQKTIRRTFLSNKKVRNQRQMPREQYINTIFSKREHVVEIEETIRIPAGEIADSAFLVEFELRNNKGFPIQTITRTVPHEQNVGKLFVPTEAPGLCVSPVNKQGKVLMEITQNDKNATGVKVYRKVVTLDEVGIGSNFVLIKTIPLLKTDGTIFIVDNFATTNPIIYRAIAFDADGNMAAEFASEVVTQERGQLAKKKNLFRRPTVLTMTHEIDGNLIRIDINNVCPGPIALELYKRDKTIKEQTFTKVQDTVLLGQDSASPITFEDDSVKQNRIYEYQARLIYKDGNVEVANNNLFVEFKPVESNIVALNVTPPKYIRRERDVRFTISKDIILNDTDIVKKFLDEQGILDEFQDDITNEKEKLQDLFFVRVMRTNMNTGEIEDFGIVDDLNFSDSKFGEVKNVKPTAVGTKYKYAIFAYARSPETLFENLTRDVTTNRQTHTFTPSKWLHPVTLTEGNIVSSQTLKRNHARTTFTFGTVVDISYVEVNLKDIMPSITNVRATVFQDDKVSVKWKLQGDASKIDHFVVTLELAGSKTIAGKSHNISSKNEFQFIDILDNDERGALRYSIVPVYFDYSKGTEVQSDRIFI